MRIWNVHELRADRSAIGLAREHPFCADRVELENRCGFEPAKRIDVRLKVPPTTERFENLFAGICAPGALPSARSFRVPAMIMIMMTR